MGVAQLPQGLLLGGGGDPLRGEPVPTPLGRIAVFADPDGNLVGLLSRRDA
ncbi:hypothetical protein [Nonomuraea helvata]|uniref:VOC domain-containing protein n=1 Tax=Nonomuraea helvata TaxID=37484 RepID=A0ABV5S7A6_9ACTN